MIRALRRGDRAHGRQYAGRRAAVRFSVGAVHVLTGNFIYFDNGSEAIEPEHIMASGALPPPPPMIKIGTDYEFSATSMREHWQSGYEDTKRTLKHRKWLEMPGDGGSILVHDVHRQDD
jgi:Patatin phospholipase